MERRKRRKKKKKKNRQFQFNRFRNWQLLIRLAFVKLEIGNFPLTGNWDKIKSTTHTQIVKLI